MGICAYFKSEHAGSYACGWKDGIYDMRRFELKQPSTLEEACGVLNENTDAKVIAGGTALLTLIKHGLFVPQILVNLKQIKTASEITYDPKKGLRIGALATIYDVEASPVVRQNYPMLAEACHVVANIRIRNMATVGGNLAHGDYQSDPPTALVAMDATVEVLSTSQKRRISLSEFLRGSYETALEPGELVSAVLVPPVENRHGKYIKFTTGSSEERPCAGVAALVQMTNGVCGALRLVVGAVSPRPVCIQKAEEIACGEKLTTELLAEISAEACRAVDPIDDLRGTADYKRHLVGVLAGRAVTAAARCE